MKSFRPGLGYRVLWGGFASVLFAITLGEFLQNRSYASGFTSTGWALWVAAWFMAPLIPTTKFRELIKKSAPYAAGPPGLRAIVTFGGLLCIAIGLLLRLAGGA
jgi:hypothetical protein